MLFDDERIVLYGNMYILLLISFKIYRDLWQYTRWSYNLNDIKLEVAVLAGKVNETKVY